MQDVIPVTRSSMPPFDEYTNEISDLWENRWLTNMGSKHQELERKLCEMIGAEHVALLTNGHLALEVAIEAMALTGEVITTPFTFASTTQAIVRSGLTPVFCDISPEDFTIDVSKIEALITPRTSAIVPVHVYGNICNVEEIERIAKKYGLKVIYDAAHAFAEKRNGVDVGCFGDLSMFSFHATKVFHTIEGGGIVCHDQSTYNKIAALKNFGQYSAEDIGEFGGNAKMSEFQAAMGLCNLRHLHENIYLRKQAVDIYRKYLTDEKGIYVCPVQEGVQSNFGYFPILVDPNAFGMDRDSLCQKLKDRGILCRKYFYPATNKFRCYQGRFTIQETPVAEKVSKQVLALPLYSELSTKEAAYICKTILEARQ